MTTISSKSTLGDIVTGHPDLARELERRSLDYCCGGRQTLAEACGELGLEPEVVAAELAAVTSAPAAGWASLGIRELADHIESTHHAYLHEELPRLAALVAKVRSVHGDRHPELVEIEKVYEELHQELVPHLMKEERILFPAIRELEETGRVTTGPGTVGPPISVMISEHDRAGELLAGLRRLTGDYTPPADGCASYQQLFAGLAELEADTHLHVHKENNSLFPRALESELSAGGGTVRAS